VTFVDNAMDNTTATIRLKATFANEKKRLWPGQFVNTVLTLTSERNAVVVPAQAMQTGQNGQFVFVVKSDNTVESRPVAVGRTVNGVTVIEKGLAQGETVVTDGQLRLIPGAKISITSDAAPVQH
jgi:multidrug efflux system membrane fusion protein